MARTLFRQILARHRDGEVMVTRVPADVAGLASHAVFQVVAHRDVEGAGVGRLMTGDERRPAIPPLCPCGCGGTTRTDSARIRYQTELIAVRCTSQVDGIMWVKNAP